MAAVAWGGQAKALGTLVSGPLHGEGVWGRLPRPGQFLGETCLLSPATGASQLIPWAQAARQRPILSSASSQPKEDLSRDEEACRGIQPYPPQAPQRSMAHTSL